MILTGRKRKHTRPIGEADFADMQSLVRFAHGHLPDSRFQLLCIKDRRAAGQWLQTHTVNNAASAKTLPTVAMQLAFSSDGLASLGLPEDTINQFSDEFITGMSGDESRSRRLGDVEGNAPGNWRWGHHERTSMHVALLLYAQAGHIDEYEASLKDATFNAAFDVLHSLPTTTLKSKEPFGFEDGISQPVVDWSQLQGSDSHDREHYSNLLAPGEVVLGYPNEYGELTRRPVVDAKTNTLAQVLPAASDKPETYDFGLNGSYLVIRQLCQDVDGFWQYMRQQGHGDEQLADSLAASMIGRSRDGKPLIDSGCDDIPGIEEADRHNRFTYDNDPAGLQCPVGAHIRRSNPRTGDLPSGTHGVLRRFLLRLGFKRRSEYDDLVASSRFHRILRRGRTFEQCAGERSVDAGQMDSSGTISATVSQHEAAINDDPSSPLSENGLQFICLAGNISRQFEFVQSAWSISASFAGMHAQRDPITAHRQPLNSGDSTDSFTRLNAQGLPARLSSLPQFVTVCGGGYFFLPGVRAIAYLACLAQQAESVGGESFDGKGDIRASS